jgi:NAD(P)-dependent dehydrogenase (short-subunit alcohol dehydrogenase family)
MDSPQPVFAGKVIAITGGARGIGFATARYLIERGAMVALADILSEQVEEAVMSLEKEFPGSEMISSEVDVRDAVAVEEWLLSVKDMHGRIDGCVNGAGVHFFCPFEATSDC